ncbi:MAG TPA: SDR family oxidoreductase [Gemmataceae bacterium]|nr:SDR family oxidoreductase [Gemmataceae bacterium]
MSVLANQVCLVTGGSSGIGLATANRLLEQGARVAIAGRSAEKLARAAEQWPRDRTATYEVDVADARQVQEMVDAIVARWGGLDLLVNNAGLNIKKRTLRELTPEAWNQLIRTNLDGAFYCIHAVLPVMRRQQRGLVINISSVAGKRAGPLGGAAYAASKFGMSALGICLGAEEKDAGIRVCNIYPGEVDTPILENRPQPVTSEHRQSILQPEDVALAVEFVASLPARVSVPELVIKPTSQVYV